MGVREALKSSFPGPGVLPGWLRERFHHSLLPESSQLGAALLPEAWGRGSKHHAVDAAWLLLSQNENSSSQQRDFFLKPNLNCVSILPPIFLVLKYLSFLVATWCHTEGKFQEREHVWMPLTLQNKILVTLCCALPHNF